MIQIVLASRNSKKKKELEDLLRSLAREISIATLDDFPQVSEVEEDGKTFAENARKKAGSVAQQVERWALGDDSGLSVDALQGAPGILSARYSGEPCNNEKNIQKLLAAMESVPDDRRSAHFTCALALADSSGRVQLEVEERCFGTILRKPRGSNGFGYDPVFYYPPLEKSFAELDADEKHRVSHRGRAMASLLKKLNPMLREMR